MVFELFDQESRRAVVFAQEEARKLNHPEIAHEHLLLGILANSSSATAHLNGYLVTYQDVRSGVLERRPQGKVTPAGHIPFVDEAKRVFVGARKIAEARNHTLIYPEHLAIALFAANSDIVNAILEELELNEELAIEDLVNSAQTKEDARATANPATRPAPSLKVVTQLLNDDATPRGNLAEALKMLTEHMDEEILLDIIAILKK